MRLTYDVDGDTRTLYVHGLRMEVALSLLPDHAVLEGMTYA